MAELDKVLHIKKDGTEETAKIYSTTDEAGVDYIKCLVDNTVAYIPIGETDSALATAARVLKDGITYAIKSRSVEYARFFFNATGTQSFTIPAGVTTIAVTAAGAGGGGGGYACNEYLNNASGGSGGYGELVIMTTTTVTPLSDISITVGIGGGAGVSNKRVGTYSYVGGSGTDGGSSSAADVTAGGGGGGGGATANTEETANGSAGADAGNGRGSVGGSGGYVTIKRSSGDSGDFLDKTYRATAGKDGWVVVEYGGLIGAKEYKTESYTTAGTYEFTVPNGVKAVSVELAGGGGGYRENKVWILSAEGVAGGLVFDFVDVTPNETYTIVVGAGGVKGANGNDSTAFGLTSSDTTAKSYRYGAGGSGGTKTSTTGGDGWVILRYWG